ncbi:hypothetical protein [Rhodoferax sp.]|uniref:hypothetical protein n=1 Tax=Rhodoferax sp. TaxID=50421 RepID=UPI00374C9765
MSIAKNSGAEMLTPPDSLPLNRTADKYAIFGGLALLWLLFTLPTVLLSQWFPLDIPALFNMGDHLHEWLPWILSPHNGSGRYFPIYWLYHCVQYLAFGANVGPYFVVLSVVYLVGTILICRIMWRMTGSVRIAGLLFVALYLNSPTAENLTTIGKGEPLAFCLLAFVITVFRGDVIRGGMTRGSMALSALLFVTAIWIKETSLVLIGFSASGMVLCFVLGRVNSRYLKITPVRPYVGLSVGLSAGWLISKLPYVIAPKMNSLASYTDYRITVKMVTDNLLFYIQQQPDVLFFGLIALVLLATAFRSQWRQHGDVGAVSTPAMLVFALSLCAMGWAYWLAMLFWRWPMSYYMLLPSIIFKLGAFYGLYLLAHHGPARFWLVTIIKVMMTSVIACSAFAVYYIGASQIAYSRVYTDALVEYQKISGGKVPLVIESYPFYSEQVGGTEGLLKNQLGGFTSRLTGIAEVLDPAVATPEMLDLLQVTPSQMEANVNNMPRKGEYLLVFTGNKLATWFLRGVTPYYSEDSMLKLEHVYDMELVAEKSIQLPAVFLHEWTKKLDFGLSYVGFKLYRVLTDKPRFLWRGRYPDGWVGFKSSLKIDRTFGKPVMLKLSAPDFTLPNRVSITKDGVLLKVLEFNDPNQVTVDLGPPPADSTQLSFEVERAIAPKDIRLNKDSRKLGLLITLVDNLDVGPAQLSPSTLTEPKLPGTKP